MEVLKLFSLIGKNKQVVLIVVAVVIATIVGIMTFKKVNSKRRIVKEKAIFLNIQDELNRSKKKLTKELNKREGVIDEKEFIRDFLDTF